MPPGPLTREKRRLEGSTLWQKSATPRGLMLDALDTPPDDAELEAEEAGFSFSPNPLWQRDAGFVQRRSPLTRKLETLKLSGPRCAATPPLVQGSASTPPSAHSSTAGQSVALQPSPSPAAMSSHVPHPAHLPPPPPLPPLSLLCVADRRPRPQGTAAPASLPPRGGAAPPAARAAAGAPSAAAGAGAGVVASRPAERAGAWARGRQGGAICSRAWRRRSPSRERKSRSNRGEDAPQRPRDT